MKNISISLLIIVISSVSCASQSKINHNNNLKMTLDEFDIKIEGRIKWMQKLDTINNVLDAIEMVRLYNTISHNPTMKQNNYDTYTKLFFDKYLNETVQLLKALPTKGMAYYSKEYDLYIGGFPHSNSQYHIIN